MTLLGLTGLINFFSSISIAIFAIIQNPRSIKNQTFFLLNFSVALFSFGYFFWQLARDQSSAIFWFRILFVGIVLINPTYLHFVFSALEKVKIRAYRHILGLIYLVNAVFIYLNIHLVLFPSLEPRFGLGYWPNPTIYFHIYLAFWLFQCLLGLFYLLNGYIHSTGIKNQQIKYFMLGAVVGFLGGATNWLVWYRIHIPPYLNILITFYILITAYAILRHRLIDIEIVAKRGFVYSMLLVFVMAIYSLGIFIASQLFQKFGISPWALAVIGSVVIAAGFLPLYKLLTDITDKYFFRKKYEYQKTLLELSKGLNQLMPLELFAKLLVRRVIRTLRLTGAAVAVFDENENSFLVLDGQRQMVGLKGQAFSPADPMILAIMKDDSLLIEDIEDQLKRKKQDEGELKLLAAAGQNMRRLEASLVVPAKFEKQTIAIILLGEKLSQEQFSDEDITLFTTLSNQAAMALTNVKVYDEALGRFRAEQKKSGLLLKQLDQSQRMASLGVLAAGVAHEIRNPLFVVRGQLEMLTDKDRSKEYLDEFKNISLKNLDRALSIAQEMLGLSRSEKKMDEKIDINAVIGSILKFFSAGKVKVVKELGSIPPVIGNEGDVKRLFINLFENAAHSMPQGGILKISTAEAAEDGRKTISVEVADTGHGIAKENIERIFDPFFSTRHEGAGLGLSIVYRIIREHGGSINVESEPGKGTKFTLKFPLDD